MIRLWIALWLSLASPGLAQPVRVTSGEHDGFTRLVFDYGRPVDWQVGRSLDGYELRLAEAPPPYDLSNAFDLIGTSRLAAIWSAPDSGQLNIGLACACHAIPFEFRPGIIVIDLKDGAPPTGSSFEVMLDGTLADPITPRAVTRPRSRPQVSDATAADEPTTLSGVAPYDWTKSVHADLRASQGRLPVSPIPPSEAALLPPDPGLQPLRDQILHQIARGASQGVVDMALPTPEKPEKAPAPHPSTQIRIGEAQTSVTSADRSQQGDLDAQGHPCTDAKALTFSDWGDETLPAVDQMATLRQGLIGEFDRPDPEALASAIQFQLFLGFGAEARQLISVLDEPPPAAETWRALSFLVDGETDPAGRFEGQAACAGPAALWAVLGDPALSPGDPIDTGAVRLAFSDLPLHLRRLIGPPLAERLLQLGEAETARALKDAITRAPGDAGHAVALMEATLELHSGNPSDAEKTAATVLNDGGPNQPEALITLTEARIAQSLPMAPDTALALRAHLEANRGTALEPRLEEAIILAEAAAGNFEAAFDGLSRHPRRTADVWALAANLAPDDTFLAFAVLGADTGPPVLPDTTAAMIARRLVGLGLPTPAGQWLSTVDEPDPLLVAEAAIMRRDGGAALPALDGREGDVVDAMKLEALTLLGADKDQAELFEQAGDVAAASAALARAGEWEALAQGGEEPWKSLAERLPETPASTEGAPDQPAGPLARGHDLAKAGAETRQAIEALLAAIPAPARPASNAGQDAAGPPLTE